MIKKSMKHRVMMSGKMNVFLLAWVYQKIKANIFQFSDISHC